MTLWVPDLASGFVNAKQRSSTRMTTLYGFQPFTCGFGSKTAWFAPEWQDYIASSHHLWFCACKTAPLGLELQVSVGQRPHLCFFMQNSDFRIRPTSLYGSQTSSVDLCNQIGDITTRITCLYGSQPSSGVLCFQHSVLTTRLTSPYGSSPVDLWMQNSVLSTRISSLYGSQPSSVDLCIQNIDFITRIKWLYGFQTSPLDLWMQNSVLVPEWQLYMGSNPSPVVLEAKQRDLHQNDKTILLPAITCGSVHVKQHL